MIDLRQMCRMPGQVRHLTGPLGCLLVFALAIQAPAKSLREDTEALLAHPHRLAGTPAYADAATYVEQRLREIGLEQVIVQEFPTAQVQVDRCELVTKGGRTLPLVMARPNGVIPPITPPEGLTGELVDAGDGSDDQLNQIPVKGHVVVMDYNANMQWLKAMRLGAQAVIFVGGEQGDAFDKHYVRANANLPRYAYAGSRSDLPFGETVTIHAEAAWKRVTGRNVIAFIPGTDPEFEMGLEEAIVLSANLDSFGEFPEISPAARSAANCAGLLQLADTFKNYPPKRHIVLAFFDNQARSHAGAIAFYWALEDKINDATVAARLQSWQTETEFLVKLSELIDRPNPMDHLGEEGGRRLVERLGNKARDRALDIRSELMDLRQEQNRLRTSLRAIKDDAEAVAGVETRIDEISTDIATIKATYQRWNDLRRTLSRKLPVVPEIQDLFDEVVSGVRHDIELRRKELVVDKSMLDSSSELFTLLGNRWISLHVSMLLGDQTDRWGLLIGGDSEIRSQNNDQPGLYGKVQQSFLRAYESLAGSGISLRHFETATVDNRLTQPRLMWAAKGLIHGGEVAGRDGIYNIALGSMLDRLPREGTPADTLENLNLQRIETNLREIGSMMTAIGSQEAAIGDVEAVADQRGLSLRRVIASDYSYIVPQFRKDATEGALVMGRHRGSSIPNRPIAGAVVQVSYQNPWYRIFWPHDKFPAFDPFQVVLSDQNGAYTVGGLPDEDSTPKPVAFAAYFTPRGDLLEVSDMPSRNAIFTRVNMIRARSGHYMMSPRFWPDAANVFDAVGNANLGSDGSERANVATLDGVVAFHVEDKVDHIKIFGEKSAIGLGNDEVDPDTGVVLNPLGDGFPITTNWGGLQPSYQGAGDLWRINESRLALLRTKDILNSSLEEMHGRVQDLYEASLASTQSLHGESLAASAMLGAQPVYENVRAMMDDLVSAVLVLLALCIPFAFALERLLIGSTMIYKQMSWFSLFFILTFMILYYTHPAFAVAQTPIIIFLGFAVVVLSSLVIFIIMQKFEVELKAMQGMTSTVHAADISRFNTVMAAMSMGISTMRRRPLRTALTAVTIILLTFTILCFASFDTQRGIVRFFSAPSPGYSGVLYHPPRWGTINPDYVELVKARWAQEATVTTRHWVCPEFPGDPDFVVGHADGSNPVVLKGILGIQPEELAHRADLREMLQIDDPQRIRDHVFITEAVAELLGVQPGDQVVIKGIRLTVGPLLNATRLSAIVDMDNTSVIPIDYAQMQETEARQSAASSPEDMLTEQGNWANLPTDSVVLMSDRNCEIAGGKVSVIHLYTRDTQDASVFAEDLARMMDRTPIVATRADGVYRHIQGTVVAASGVGDLLFPVLLGGLVIFGTMLGSVADREKEIYTFSALGLAPPHVASLFFAEALVYSVLGGMGGYLIAQGTMKLLTFLATYGLVQVPEMNYSSTNAIVTILIVMATVLISAIFPAIKASKSANPGLLRSWKPPTPEGDEYKIIFPFTVSEYDLTGVVSFLKEHFDNFSDTGLGAFMARNTRMIQHDNGALGLRSSIALAPFDLGVTQEFELWSAPSEIQGIDEVNIRLIRKSGQPSDWTRLNRNLFDDLRKQFLLWRSIPKETMEHYRQQTLVALKSGTVKT